jgi:hypothetical protein
MTSNETLINSCVSPLNEAQRAKLKSLCKLQAKGKNYTAAPNKPLEDYIATLRILYPNMFQSKESLKTRVFVDTPASIIPYERCVRTVEESPRNLILEEV